MDITLMSSFDKEVDIFLVPPMLAYDHRIIFIEYLATQKSSVINQYVFSNMHITSDAKKLMNSGHPTIDMNYSNPKSDAEFKILWTRPISRLWMDYRKYCTH